VSRFHLFSCTLFPFQNQLSHGFSYSERRGDYGGSISLHNNNNNNNTNNNNNNGSITRLAHDQDPVALHQALQSAVEDGQNPVIDENVGYMSDLPMLKSEYFEQFSHLFKSQQISYNIVFCAKNFFLRENYYT
jgi:hypothetical protein